MRFFVDLQQPIVFPRTMKIYRSELTKIACKNMTLNHQAFMLFFFGIRAIFAFILPTTAEEAIL